MQRLDESGLRPVLERRVQVEQAPVLGVCVGMQMLARSSDEGVLPGLGWVDGRVRSMADRPDGTQLPLPHMGWNDVTPSCTDDLFRDSEVQSRFYFLHSFYFECARQEDVLAATSYGGEFACAVRSGNVYGVQFHPEKSHHFGTRLLRNFAELEC
jgi:glutamine amidotransferase